MSLSQVIGSVVELVERNPISAINLTLIAITLTLSYYSYSFQVRAAVRESIEQLDDLKINRESKVKPILHGFDFGPFRPSSEVKFLFLNPRGNHAAVATKPLKNVSFLHSSRIDRITDHLEDNFEIEEATVTENSIIINIRSRSPVEVRAVVESLYHEFIEMNRDIEGYLSSSNS